MRAGALLATMLAAVVLGLARVAPVAGSCAQAADLEVAIPTAEAVFVGTVSNVTNDGRWATVRVEERWRGPQLPESVQVRGGPDPGAATSVDRTYVPGRYLFVVRNGPGYLVDDACTPTTPWTDDLARLRPPNVQPNLTGGPGETPAVTVAVAGPLIALGVALAIATIAYLIIVRARRRPPDWMR